MGKKSLQMEIDFIVLWDYLTNGMGMAKEGNPVLGCICPEIQILSCISIRCVIRSLECHVMFTAASCVVAF